MGRGALAVAAVLVSLALYVGLRFHQQQQFEASATAAAAADPRLQRPLESTEGRIAFVVQQRQTEDLYTIDADGSGLTRLTQLPPGSIMSRPPAWSPDGTTLAFAMSAGDRRNVYTLRAERSSTPQMIRAGAHSPAWAPDSQRLAFLGDEKDRAQHVYVASFDGSPIVDLAADWPAFSSGFSSDLVWSPDGRRLAFVRTHFVSGRRRNSNILVANTDGSGLTDLTRYPDTKDNLMQDLVWSPDGQALGFSYFDRGWSLVTIDTNGSGRAELGRSATMQPQFPSWSPDGRLLAWSNPRSIVTSDPQGGRQTELTMGRGGGVQPAWSPDGTRIVFVRDHWKGELCVMNRDGSGLTRLTEIGQSTSYPVWRPRSST